MIRLPPKRERLHSGIERGPQRVFPRHRAWVRRHGCCVPGCQGMPIEFAHLRTAANSGVGLKPPDWCGISLCMAHHSLFHNVGHSTGAKQCGTSLGALLAIAVMFAERSPDKALREAMRQAQ